MKKYLWFTAGTMVVMFAGIAYVQQTARRNDYCGNDVKKHCPKEPNYSKRMLCLKEHKASLSPECVKALEKVGAAAKKVVENCGKDSAKFCGKAGRESFPCLAANEPKLTEACRLSVQNWLAAIPGRIADSMLRSGHKKKDGKKNPADNKGPAAK